MDAAEARRLLDRQGIRPDKAMGQNFLLDRQVAMREIEHANIDSGDTVLEIGPGLGTLTFLLAERARRVVAYEASEGLCRLMRGRFPGNVELVNQDFLEADVERPDKVVSNVPYSISSPLTFKLFDVGFDAAVLMFQREFAERLAAPPGSKSYSRISVKCYMHADVEMLETVSASAFYPEPKVDSAVVRMVGRPAPFTPTDPDRFDLLVDVLFSHRRKKISSTLRLAHSRLGIDKERLAERKGDVPFGDMRVESLSPEEIEQVSVFIAGLRATS